MDDSFQSDTIQTPCISDTVTVDDFTQIQTSVHSSPVYDLQVFTPSFDTTEDAYVNSSAAALKTSENVDQNVGKNFLEEENIIDMQLYESLQNHHNYSMKPSQDGATEEPKQETGSMQDFALATGLASPMAGTENTIVQCDDTDDQTLDISDPLKEICRSSSPLYIPDRMKDVQTNEPLSGFTQTEDRTNGNKESSVKSVLDKLSHKRGIITGDYRKEGKTGDLEESLITSEKDEVRTNVEKCDNHATALLESAKVVDENLSEKSAHEKNMFSENLGLIPADSDIKSLTEKKKTGRKGVRTRKSFVRDAEEEASENDDPVKGHHHIAGLFRCGSCNKTFVTICKLHQHLQDHGRGGSYHFNHIIKTAFPTFDSVCAFTQTSSRAPKFIPRLKPFRKMSKLKVDKDEDEEIEMEEEVIMTKVKEPVLKKKKRGRPPKAKQLESTQTKGQVKGKDKIVCKLKVKPEERTDTLKEVKGKSKEPWKSMEVEEEELELLDMSFSDREYENEINKNRTGEGKYTIEIVNDVTDVIKEKNKDSDITTGKSRKRKMTTPRKIPNTEQTKIVNSRSRPNNKIQCDFCASEFQYTRGLLRHELEKHSDEMKFECDECDQRFMRAYNLERHKLCAHTVGKSRLLRRGKGISAWKEKKKRGRKPLERPPEDMYACEVCGKLLPESKAEIHVRIHSGKFSRYTLV